MSQLIKLTVSKKITMPGFGTIQDAPALFGFDIEDIITPIRRNAGNTVSYFTARQVKGAKNGRSEQVGRIDYEVSEALTNISGQSIFLANLTVLFRSERMTNMASEKMVFVRQRISESLRPWIDPNTGMVGGTQFYYHEDGETDLIKYIVQELVDDIVGAETSAPGGGGPVTEIDYNLNGGTNIDLTGYAGDMIVNVFNNASVTGIINSLSNYSAITKLTIRAKGNITLTVNDGDPSVKLSAPSLALYGLHFGFLELQPRNGKMFQYNYIDQYN